MKDDHATNVSTPSNTKLELQNLKPDSQLSETVETEAWTVKKLRERSRNNPIR
jgi:hypothetical protein